MNTTPDRRSADPEQIIADLRRQLAEREAERLDETTTERDEALAREAATAEVLQVINASAGDLTPVFDAILEQAHQLCGAAFGALNIYAGDKLGAVAVRGLVKPFAERVQSGFIPSDTHPASALKEGAPFVQVTDIAEVNDPMARAAFKVGGLRTVLFIPLRQRDRLLGNIVAARPEVRTFTDKQIALLQNFAAQAVIAMENARLLTETREALEQQTATAEVLQVINSSPGDLTPVFDAILRKAHILCGAEYGVLLTYDGEVFWPAAVHGDRLANSETFRRGLRPGFGFTKLIRGERLLHIHDMAKLAAEMPDDPVPRALFEISGIRTQLAVPLRRDDKLLGIITANRREVRPFVESEIALLENFAAQAVIAMENARLLTETREALEQQTATAEVLQVINSSPGDLQPVFEAILEKAHNLCGVASGALQLYDGEKFRAVATNGLPEPLAKWLRDGWPPGSSQQRVVAGEADVIHIADLAASDSPRARHVAEIGGVRTLLYVALRKDQRLLGVISASRFEVRPFSEKEIALLENFAAQAVIAMENARLLTETREALEQQTATAEVLQVINSSPGDLAPVFEAMLEKATRLCEAPFGNLRTWDGERFHFGVYGDPQFSDWVRQRGPLLPDRDDDSPLGQIIKGEQVVRFTVAPGDEGRWTSAGFKEMVEISGMRSGITVALNKDEALLGTISVYRQEVRPFSDKQIGLLQNFAAQAVIAIENARLLGELQHRTEEVAELNRGLEARVAEQVEELGRVGRLKRFLAPQLAELIVSQGNEQILESHRREIVVVFCDLRGYTAFAETAEPEEVLDFLRDYHGALGPLVAQFEGTLDQFSGDGIMVFFNDPVPCADPAERAVKMAMAMRDAAGALLAKWRRRGRELGFGAGIAQGYATLGQIGFADRSGYTAIGTVCNLAARLCAEAKDGQILVAQRVAIEVEKITTLEEIGALALKGLTQPVVAYNVPLVGSQAAFRVIEGGPQSH